MIGAGTDYALLLVARYREELRRHEDRHEAMAFALHRAAPALFASAATVALGMLCLLFAEMNSTAGLGPIAAIGIAVTFAGDGHPAARAARHHRPLDLLAAPPGVRLGRADPDRLLGQGRALDRPATAQGLGRSPPCCSPSPASACFALDTDGLSTEDSYTKEFESITGQQVLVDAGLVDQSNTVMVVANAGSEDAVAAAHDRARRRRAPQARRSRPGTSRSSRPPSTSDPASPEAFAIVERVRDAVHAVDGADALVGGNSAFFLDTKDASNRDNIVIIPIILLAGVPDPDGPAARGRSRR